MILVKHFYLLLLLQAVNGQNLMKRFTFSGKIWPHYVYKNISNDAKSKIECAALCKTDSMNCNSFFYNPDLMLCGLANLNKFNINTVEQQGAAFGYINLGICYETYILRA